MFKIRIVVVYQLKYLSARGGALRIRVASWYLKKDETGRTTEGTEDFDQAFSRSALHLFFG